MEAPKKTHYERVQELAEYPINQIARDVRDDKGIRKLNPYGEVGVPINLLHRGIQPAPCTHRRKLSLIVNHMFYQGYYAKRPTPPAGDN